MTERFNVSGAMLVALYGEPDREREYFRSRARRVADIGIKMAMLNVQSAIKKEDLKSRLLLQIHDELILEVVAGEEEKISDLVRREMGAAYPLKAPLDVNAGLGLTWHEAAH